MMEAYDVDIKMKMGIMVPENPPPSPTSSCGQRDDEGSDGDAPSFEDVLKELGTPGFYQIAQLTLIYLSWTLGASLIYNFVFIGYEPPHTCNTVNETEIFTSLQLENDSTASLVYESCQLKVLTNRSGLVEQITDLSCPSGRNFSDGRHASILSEWDLVCESAGIGETVALLFAVGMFIGGIVASVAADRFGRKRIFLSTSVVVAILESVIIFTPNIIFMGILRFFSGIFLQGNNCASLVMITELLTPKERTVFGIVDYFFWVLCTLLAGALAYATKDYGWRACQATTALLGAIFPLYLLFVKESSRWLSVNGRTQEALDILRTASRQNKRDFNRVRAKYMEYISVERRIKKNEESKRSNPDINVLTGRKAFLQEFCEKKIIFLTSINSFSWLTHTLIYYGMYMMSSTLSGDRFFNFTLMALTEIPSFLAMIVLLPRMGRCKVMALFLSLASASLLVCSLMATFAHDAPSYYAVSLIFFLVGKFAISASFGILYIYTPEVFPTNIRTIGFGISSSVGRIGAILVPYVRPFYGVSTWGPVATFCAMSVVTLIFTPFMPEMKDVNLADTSQEVTDPKTRKRSEIERLKQATYNF